MCNVVEACVLHTLFKLEEITQQYFNIIRNISICLQSVVIEQCDGNNRIIYPLVSAR